MRTSDIDKVLFLCEAWMNEKPCGLDEVLKAMGGPYETDFTFMGGRYGKVTAKVRIGNRCDFNILINHNSVPRYIYGTIDKRTTDAGLKLLELIQRAKEDKITIPLDMDSKKLERYFDGKMPVKQALGLIQLYKFKEEAE